MKKPKPVDHYSLISEKAFTSQVIKLAKVFGWRVAHFRPAMVGTRWVTAMQGDIGFPDLVLARAGKVIFAELKSETGKLSPTQRKWIDALTSEPSAGVTACIWRPRHIGLIEAELR